MSANDPKVRAAIEQHKPVANTEMLSILRKHVARKEADLADAKQRLAEYLRTHQEAPNGE